MESRRRMWTVAALVTSLAASGAAACNGGPGPADPRIEGSCIAGVQLDGRFYAHTGELGDDAEVGEVVGTVLRRVGCYDTPGVGDPEDTVLYDGDANFLPVGTTIHVVEGEDPDVVLAAQSEGTWVVVRVEEG